MINLIKRFFKRFTRNPVEFMITLYFVVTIGSCTMREVHCDWNPSECQNAKTKQLGNPGQEQDKRIKIH